MLLLLCLSKDLLLAPVRKVVELVQPLVFLIHLSCSTGETLDLILQYLLKLGREIHFVAIR